LSEKGKKEKSSTSGGKLMTRTPKKLLSRGGKGKGGE